MYELSRKQFVFFFVFSDYGRVLCTNKRLYIRLARTGSRKTYCKAFYLNPIGFAPISGLWRMVFVKALPTAANSPLNCNLSVSPSAV